MTRPAPETDANFCDVWNSRWAIGALALVVRVLFVWAQTRFHLFDIYFVASDSRVYLAGVSSTVMPLYPLFLKLVGSDPFTIGLVQCAIGAVTCVLVALIGERVYSARVGWWAGVLAALNLHLIWWTGYVLTETLFTFWVVASLWALVWWLKMPTLTRMLVAALCGVGGVLTRGHWLLFVLLVTVLWRGQTILMLSACLVALMLSAHALHAPLFTSMSGELLYQGNSDGATGGTGGYVDAKDFTRLPENTSAAYRSAALTFMRQHPGRVLALMPRKFWNQWRPTYAGASVKNWLLFGGSYLLLLSFALVGLYHGWQAGHGLLLLALLFFVGFHLILPGMIRYRVPAEPIVCVFAAQGWSLARARRIRTI